MRDYNAALGRYAESDPFGLMAGVNTYGYVGQNPLWGLDPWGLADLNYTTAGTNEHSVGDLYNPPNVFSIVAHGTPQFILGPNGTKLGADKLSQIIKSDPHYRIGETVVLLSCNTGRGPNPLAAQLSNILDAHVIAPNDIVWAGQYQMNNQPQPLFNVGPTPNDTSGQFLDFGPTGSTNDAQ
jgi:hypothetical protein